MFLPQNTGFAVFFLFMQNVIIAKDRLIGLSLCRLNDIK